MKNVKGQVKEWLGYILALIAVLSFVYFYIDLREKNTELANKVHNLELQNAELMQIRERYLELIESLIREGKVNIKDLSASSLPQKEVEMINSRLHPMPSPTPNPSVSSTPVPTPNPEQLLTKIKQLQGVYVKDSTGTEADQAFTDDDLNQFIRDKKTTEIIERLEKDNDFKALVNAIKAMDSEKRSDLLDRGLKTYRHPWSELHLNPKIAPADELRKGQTVAGSKAEKLIAQTVVDLVRQMI